MSTQKRSVLMAAGFFALGAVLAALGIWRGEPGDIMRKAIVVCLECIGVG